MIPSKLIHAIDIERSLHSLKTALACLIGFALIRFTHFPLDQWLIVTIIVVMTAQISVGSMLQKSYLRFLGTLAGSVIAALTLKIVGNHFVPIAIIIVLSIIVFSYVATGPSNFREAGTLGAVTVVIILVGSHPTIWTALIRFLEISAGIVIAALVSQFVLPIHARTHLRRSQIETINQLREYYQNVLSLQENDSNEKMIQALEQPIIKSITKQRTLAELAKREPLGKKFNSEYFTQFLQCEIEILRSIDFMHYAYKHDKSTLNVLKNISSLHTFHIQIIAAMQIIEEIIEHHDHNIQDFSIPSLILVKEEIHQSEKKLSDEKRITIHGFLFCTEILVEQLKKLMLLYSNLDHQ